jgi:hypothetical protein
MFFLLKSIKAEIKQIINHAFFDWQRIKTKSLCRKNNVM